METQGEQTITYNGKTYKISALSEDAKKQLNNIQATEIEINRLLNLLSMIKTAQTVYHHSLIGALPQ